MKNFITFCCLVILSSLSAKAQIETPDKFLNYPLGTQFTPHYKVANYVEKIANAATERVKLINYGETNEGRPLMVAIISSKENIARLEQIRTNNIKLANAEGANLDLNSQPAIVWLSYNVHGNEASSTEAAMKTLYNLASGLNIEANEWLKNTVVILDPCLNPDGRDRYVNYFNSVVGKEPNPDPDAREHNEPWPGGRSNHYNFDLNRDWAWQTQVESKQRLALYHQWMPQVHVDFHEQAFNQPYYFAPAAEPIHKNVTAFQRKFQVIVGKNNAKYFDRNGWKYFTKQEFDLLYPSYGDTYPLYNGAIGMTYEQGGIRAGLAVITKDGDTLKLSDRIDHHFTTGMATIEISSKNKSELLSEFRNYFQKGVSNPPGIYSSYVVKADNISRMKKLTELLANNHISFSFGGNQTTKGFNYANQKEESFTIGRNDLVVNLHQPAAVLADVLFEPNTIVTDSNTYDITAWALPYVFGLNAYATKESLKGTYQDVEKSTFSNSLGDTENLPLAWAFDWGSAENANFLVALQKANIKVRQAEAPFSVDGKDYSAGTLLVMRAENETKNNTMASNLTAIIGKYQSSVHIIKTGFVDRGDDFGSSSYPLLSKPKVALVSGEGVSSLGFGEVWFYLEQDLNLKPIIIDVKTINSLNFEDVNTLILPSGNYKEDAGDGLNAWIKKGGKLILIEDAIKSFIGKKGFDIKETDTAKKPTDDKPNMIAFGDRDKSNFGYAIPGAIYKVNMDATHPFSYGIGENYYGLKTDDNVYLPFTEGWNVGRLDKKSLMAGIAGKKVREKLNSGLILGSQDFGQGRVVYLATNPLFRNFWEVGKTLFTNVLFCNY